MDACFTDGRFSWEGRTPWRLQQCCADTDSCLVSSRLNQSWERTQLLPGVVLGEENQLSEAESFFSYAVPLAHSALFPKLTAGSSGLGGLQPGRMLPGSASPGCGSQGTQPWGRGLPHCHLTGVWHATQHSPATSLLKPILLCGFPGALTGPMQGLE